MKNCRLLVALELKLNGFKNCWKLAGKLIKSIKEAERGELISWEEIKERL